ncbi:hypothetical protein SAMN05428977_102141 [Nitrosomonas sp. Nm166]|nr:hypothetical protein SAMN05428977_102141 [Nitrosomonas sp. Nm166]
MDWNFLKTETLQTQLNRLVPQLRWHIGRLGTIGKIGVGLLVATSIYFFSAVLPQESVLEKLKERAEILQVQALSKQAPADSEAGRKMSGDQALQAFYDFFPRIDSSPFWIRELVRIAKKQNVELSSSEYRLVNESDARLARYEMILPVRGSYPQIRAFIADALEVIPAIAISAIAIKRENITSEKLEVRLEVNLYLNK